jgi:hypothetical protein
VVHIRSSQTNADSLKERFRCLHDRKLPDCPQQMVMAPSSLHQIGFIVEWPPGTGTSRPQSIFLPNRSRQRLKQGTWTTRRGSS